MRKFLGALPGLCAEYVHALAGSINATIKATAWRMEPPGAYGAFHLSIMISGLALCVILAWRLRKLEERKLGKIIWGCGAYLLLTELYKQMFYRVCLWQGDYNWGIFPFHLCSVPMYLCLAAPLMKAGKARQAMYSFMGCFNLLGGAAALFEPSGLIHGYWTLTLHSFIWHLMLVFIGLLLCFSGLGGSSVRDFKNARLLFLLLCSLALGLNLALYDVSGGRINCFFIGPAESRIFLFRMIARRCGWWVSACVYVFSLCLGAFLIFRVMKGIKKKPDRGGGGEHQ